MASKPGWQRYADFVREQAKQHREQFDKMREQTPPTRAPERMERMSEHMQLRMKSMEAMKDETRRFYDTLTDTQKTAFRSSHAAAAPRQALRQDSRLMCCKGVVLTRRAWGLAGFFYPRSFSATSASRLPWASASLRSSSEMGRSLLAPATWLTP